MSSISEWLASLGLSEYRQRFAENAIDLSEMLLMVKDLASRAPYQGWVADPLVQIQMLRLVNRFGRRARRSQIAVRPRHDRDDGHRRRKNHSEDKCEPSWFRFRCHVSPPGARSNLA